VKPDKMIEDTPDLIERTPRLPERVVIVNDASIARGGATGLALLSARLLRARGIPVTYIAGDAGDGTVLDPVGAESVAVGGRGLVNETKLRAVTRGLYNRDTVRVMADWISRHDTPGTVYHVHGWSKILSPAVFEALWPVADRTVVHAHDFFLACPNGGFTDYPRNLPCDRRPMSADCLSVNCDKRSYGQKIWRVGRQAVLRRKFLGRPWPVVLMIHEKMARYLVKGGMSAAPLKTLRNPAEALTSERVRVEQNDGVLFIGRVEREKGIEDAIAATERANIPLRVVGDGPLREELAAAYPSVEFLGWRGREDLSSLIQTARGVVMPSRYPEPFGLVAAEAALSGVPVILARTAFLAEDFETLGIGLACNTQDHQAFEQALVQLRDMAPEAIRDMSLRAHENSKKICTTPDEWCDTLVATYRNVLTTEVAAGGQSVSRLACVSRHHRSH
jgi:glycosyltransferase involved in cell wall biosynthesis